MKENELNTRRNDVMKFSFHFELFKGQSESCLSSVRVANVNGTPPASFICVINIHPQWRSYLALQVRDSSTFRVGFSCWLVEMLRKVEAQHNITNIKLCDHCSMVIKSSSKAHGAQRTRVKVKMGSLENTMHNLEPEIKWSIRILPQVFEHLQLEAVFAWLSTLGGAHSALGDYFNKNAEIAWDLSVKQLLVALKIGDPVLAAHCKLFMSISLIQRGSLSRALKIIRSVRNAIENDKRLQEKRLVNCCKAARARLKYIQQKQKKQREMTLEV